MGEPLLRVCSIHHLPQPPALPTELRGQIGGDHYFALYTACTKPHINNFIGPLKLASLIQLLPMVVYRPHESILAVPVNYLLLALNCAKEARSDASKLRICF